VTKTKLLKLLYLFDVEYYRVHRQTFTGFGWKFLSSWPWAAEFDPALDDLVIKGTLLQQRSTRNLRRRSTDLQSGSIHARRLHSEGRVHPQGRAQVVGTRSTGEYSIMCISKLHQWRLGIRNAPLDFL